MPASYTDQFFLMDPANPPPVGTSLTFQLLNLVDQNDDGDIDRFNNDSVNGIDVVSSWPGDTVRINVPGVGVVTYTGITFYLANGTRAFTPTDGQVLQNGTFQGSTFVNTQGPLDIDDLGPVCFTPGTRILTPDGQRRIEDLKPGDLVETVDNGPQPILWIGRSRFEAQGDLAPIRFKKGVLGLDRPLKVSPQHRMVIADWRAPYFFGHDEVLVAAHKLVNGTTVKRVEGGTIDYIHLLFARHEVIIANGAKSESYFPGHAMSRSDRETQHEVLRLFPDLGTGVLKAFRPARAILKGQEACLVAI